MMAWSSRAKNPIEMRRTPWASGGTITSSIRPGGCVTPSIRGIEKPQTSASSAATRRPRCRERDGQVGGDRRLPDPALARRDREHAGVAVGERVDPGPGGRRRRRVDHLQRVRRRLALQDGGDRPQLGVVHVAEVDVDPVDPLDLTRGQHHPAAQLDPGALARQRQGERDHRGAAVDRHALDHAELHHRPPELRLRHAREGRPDVVAVAGHRSSAPPGPTSRGHQCPGGRTRTFPLSA